MNHPYEEHLWDDHPVILGMDEAGRGPICGPVCVAGVIFEPGYQNEAINDSKKLSEKKREALYHTILHDAKAYWIVMVDEQTVDELNIYRAVQKAMEDIAAGSGCDYCLSDAMPLRNGIEHEALIHGDAKSVSIAAASILAKVSRDHYMDILDEENPGYGLAKHKGYPTKAHIEALNTLGVKDFYRRSYRPVAQALEREKELKLF